MSKGHLFVISGSSGVGKSSILKEIMARRKDLQFSVSATSRPPRPGEENGVQYYFVSREAFCEMIEQGAFVEHDYHMDNYYGTLKSEILNKTKTCNLVLDVEPVGALRVREIFPEPHDLGMALDGLLDQHGQSDRPRVVPVLRDGYPPDVLQGCLCLYDHSFLCQNYRVSASAFSLVYSSLLPAMMS